MKKSLIILTLSALLLTACGGAIAETTKPTSVSDKVEIAEVVFAKSLGKKLEPVGATTEFTPTEPIYVSVRINGHPTKGIIGAKFLYNEKLISETSVDLSKPNSGEFFYVGDNTFTGFYVPHDDLFPISPNYHMDLFIDGVAAGDYAYNVIPPDDAIKTVIRKTEFAKGVTSLMEPQDETTIFSPSDSVFFIGNGDFGKYSRLQAEWITEKNELVDSCSKALILKENRPKDSFYFSCSIKDGWPIGTHTVRLTVDDVIVTEATFSVQ